MKKTIIIKDHRLKTSIKAGFVSLFAVLISLIILAITLGIATVAFKENVLASSAQEGSYALFAADSGLECALYYDSIDTFMLPDGSMSINPNIECGGQSLLTSTNPGDKTVSFKFDISMGNPALSNQSRCVDVLVDKDATMTDSLGNSVEATKIYANGYNVDCNVVADVNAGNLSNRRVVNRLLVATYPNPVPPPPTTP